MHYIVYPPWSLANDPAGHTFASAPLIPDESGRFYVFDWDILIDLTARQLIADPLTHPRWLAGMRRHRYPLYTPNARFVHNAASYNNRRTIGIPVRQIMLAMYFNIHHIHIPKMSLVSSCYEHWCVDINHVVPFRSMPASQFSIDYTDPASGRPEIQMPAWEERDLEHQARQQIADDKKRAAAKSIGLDPRLLGLPEDDPTKLPQG